MLRKEQLKKRRLLIANKGEELTRLIVANHLSNLAETATTPARSTGVKRPPAAERPLTPAEQARRKTQKSNDGGDGPQPHSTTSDTTSVTLEDANSSRTESRSTMAQRNGPPPPRISLVIEKSTTHALLDTGARLNLMHWDIFIYLQSVTERHIELRPPPNLVLTTANNHRMTPRGIAKMIASISPSAPIFAMDFLIMEDLSCPVLIGDKSLGKGALEAVIDLSERTVLFKKFDVTIPLLSRASVLPGQVFVCSPETVIPPQSAVRVELEVGKQAMFPQDAIEGKTICFESPREQQDIGWQMAGGIAKVENKSMQVLMMNVGDEVFVVQEQTHVLCCWPDDTEKRYIADRTIDNESEPSTDALGELTQETVMAVDLESPAAEVTLQSIGEQIAAEAI